MSLTCQENLLRAIFGNVTEPYLRIQDGRGLYDHDIHVSHKHSPHARWIAFLGYVSAAFLLVFSGYLDWVLFTFPAWVLLVSVHILIDNLREPQHAAAADGE